MNDHWDPADQAPMISAAQQEVLRMLTVGDERSVATVLERCIGSSECGLDARTSALVRIAALVAIDAGSSAYQHAVGDALNAGASPDDVVDLLPSLATSIGYPRVVAAAPKLALALGYDVEFALEDPDPLETPVR